jgi:hypothetical protein
VFDTSAAATAAAGKQGGVTVAGSPADVARQVGVLFTCLPNDDIVRAAYLGANGVAEGGAAGLVTCDCSTVSPEATLEVAAGLARRSIAHMDTPMLGSQPQAVSARSSSSWAASRQARDHQALSRHHGAPAHVRGPVGQRQPREAPAQRTGRGHGDGRGRDGGDVRAGRRRSVRVLRRREERRRHGLRHVLRSPRSSACWTATSRPPSWPS